MRQKLGHASQVLHGRGQGEFVSRTRQATQSQAVEFHDPFEVGEKHLHLLSFAARDEVLRCLGDASGHVSGSLMDAADDLPIRRVGAAFCSDNLTLEFSGCRRQSAGMTC